MFEQKYGLETFDMGKGENYKSPGRIRSPDRHIQRHIVTALINCYNILGNNLGSGKKIELHFNLIEVGYNIEKFNNNTS